MVLVGSLSGIFMLYASIALGQLVTKHKLLGAFGAYFLLNTVCQTVSLFLLPVLFNIQGSLFPVLFNIQSSLFPATNSGNAADVFLNLLFPMVLLFTALLAAVYYFITLWVFKKRLNLE